MLILREGKRFDYSPGLWGRDDTGLQLRGLAEPGSKAMSPEGRELHPWGPEVTELQLSGRAGAGTSDVGSGGCGSSALGLLGLRTRK